MLRREIAADYTSLPPSHLNVLSPAEGIYLTMRALLSGGDHVVVTSPGYQSLSEVARAIGCEISPWKPQPREGGKGEVELCFEPSDLKQLIRPGSTKMVIANWPHNPTGCLPSEGEADEVVGLCRANGVFLFVDEVGLTQHHLSLPSFLPQLSLLSLSLASLTPLSP